MHAIASGEEKSDHDSLIRLAELPSNTQGETELFMWGIAAKLARLQSVYKVS